MFKRDIPKQSSKTPATMTTAAPMLISTQSQGGGFQLPKSHRIEPWYVWAPYCMSKGLQFTGIIFEFTLKK